MYYLCNNNEAEIHRTRSTEIEEEATKLAV